MTTPKRAREQEGTPSKASTPGKGKRGSKAPRKASDADSGRESPGVACGCWASESDPAMLVVTHDLTLSESHFSERLYGTAEGAERSRALNASIEGELARRKVESKSLHEVLLDGLKADRAAFDKFLRTQITVVPASGDVEEVTKDDLDAFKSLVISGMTESHIRGVLGHHVTFAVERDARTGLLRTVSFTSDTLHDLFATRDFFVTPRGAIVSGSRDRRHSVGLLRYFFSLVGIETILDVPAPLQFTGRDYLPAGKQLCLVGTGRQTNDAAAAFMIEADALGTERVAVVRNLFEHHPSAPALCDVLSVVDSNCIMVSESILGANNPHRRLVSEWVRCARADGNGHEYRIAQTHVELSEYLDSLGIHVVRVPERPGGKMPSHLGVINLGGRQLLVRDTHLKQLVEKSGHFSGKVDVVPHTDGVRGQSWFDYTYGNGIMLRQRDATMDLALPALVGSPGPLFSTHPPGPPMQSTNTVLMVAPVGFCSNPETAVDNHYMKTTDLTLDEVERIVLREFSHAHMALRNAGVNIALFSAEKFHNTPDAVFPNNWFSTHSAGELGVPTLAFYPMATPSRRAERRENIISWLQTMYEREVSFVQWEMSDFPHFLESTGVLILDRINKLAYAALSQRCYRRIAETWAERLGYRLVLFRASDAAGRPIYHTNVMMSVGTSCAVVCAEAIDDAEERQTVLKLLAETGHEVVLISREQVANFAGNVLELRGYDNAKLLAMSTTAYKAFTREQKAVFAKHFDEVVHADIPLIEQIGGGSLRCMIGELF